MIFRTLRRRAVPAPEAHATFSQEGIRSTIQNIFLSRDVNAQCQVAQESEDHRKPSNHDASGGSRDNYRN